MLMTVYWYLISVISIFLSFSLAIDGLSRKQWMTLVERCGGGGDHGELTLHNFKRLLLISVTHTARTHAYMHIHLHTVVTLLTEDAKKTKTGKLAKVARSRDYRDLGAPSFSL